MATTYEGTNTTYPHATYHGQYAIANSCGLVNCDGPNGLRYQTHSKAKDAAREQSMGGWHGQCWPVRLVKPKQ